ncbi:MEDS domain-containing protein [Peribacillus sp. SCS-155]|uniref:MEDS domain-containing protein n=1 Tax=Peribacillus sedimenti TaxID=3115297 RepID=UPI003905F145
MNNKMIEYSNMLPVSKKGHIFYYFEDIQKYIENAVAYASAGVQDEGHVIFLENDRLYPVIYRSLQTILPENRLAHIYHVNNFDFYFSEGNFHPPTIFEHFQRKLHPFFESGVPVRTWGHVEWRDEDEIICSLIEFEEKAHEMLDELPVLGVCAYESRLIPESFKTFLLGCHGFQITDDKITDLTASARAQK